MVRVRTYSHPALRMLNGRKLRVKLKRQKKQSKTLTYAKQLTRGSRWSDCHNTWDKTKNLRTTRKIQALKTLGRTKDWKKVSRKRERI